MPTKLSSSVKIFYPKYSTKDLVELLKKRVPVVRAVLPLKEMWLFGSYAQGKQTPASDIDLLIVYGGRPMKDAYNKAYKALDLRGLELHVYSQNEYMQMRSLKPSPIGVMLKGAIRLA